MDEIQRSSFHSLKKTIIVISGAIGGFAGLLVIVLGVIPILQTVQESRDQAATNATLIALLVEQNEVLKEITTLEAVNISTNPSTATAIAKQVNDLEGTAEALEARASLLSSSTTTPGTPSINERISATVAPITQNAIQLTNPANGSLIHNDNNLLEARPTNVAVRDFIAESTFHNPFDVSEGHWSYGFVFRVQIVGGSETCLCYRLWVDSRERWHLSLITNVRGSNFDADIVTEGTVNNLNISENGSNKLRLVAKGEKAYFFVNDAAIAVLDVSDWQDKGGVSIATGFINGHEISGKTTIYENFVVWSL